MDKVEFNGHTYSCDEVLKKLNEFLTPERVEKISSVVGQRSDYFVPVLENLYDRGNVSAVMRSCEAFGFYKMHIIQENESFKESRRVTQGAEKWIEIEQWFKTESCLSDLKEKGYKIYTTALSEDAVSFDDLEFSEKTAVVLGNERDGVSEKAKELSDGNVLLPMQGFTQSFNISVAAALCSFSAKSKKPTLMDEEEKKRLQALYTLKTLNWPEKALNGTLKPL